MKILQLELRAFGPFTGVALDLSAGSHGLHVIYGANEAGKSSALRALKQLFYGIPERTSDNFLHPNNKLCIGATLAGADGSPIEVLRRKKRKNSLLEPDDKTPIDEALLRSLLAGVDQPRFATMFGIDHPSLVEGGEKIVRGGGDIGETLFAAGAGIANLRTYRDNLEKEADGLFTPRGSKPAINQTLAALKEAKRQAREAQLPTAEWVEHDKTLREATKRLAELDAELQQSLRERSRLGRIGDAVPVITRRRQVAAELDALGDVPILSADFAEKRREAVANLGSARKAEAAAAEAIEQLGEQIESLVVPEDLLARAEAVEQLQDRLSVYRKAQRDLPGLVASHTQIEKDAATILRSLRPELTLDAVESLRLSRAQQVEIQNLGNRHEALRKQLEQARSEIDESQRQREQTQSQLAELPATRDTTALQHAITSAQSQGDLERQLADAENELARRRRQAEIDRQKLGLFTGTLEQLEVLPLPPAETLDRFETQLAEADTTVKRLKEDLAETQQAVADRQRRIDQLKLQGDVPSEEELLRARHVRDLGWRLLRQQWQGELVEAEQVKEFLGRADDNAEPGDAELADAFEQAVRHADELADRLRREASRVAMLAELRAGQQANERESAELAERLAQARNQQQQQCQAWVTCWRPSCIEPLSPREMRAWLTRHRELVQQAEAIRTQEDACRQLKDRIREHRDQLQHHVGRLGEPVGSEDEPLAALLARCKAAVERIDTAANSRLQLERDLKKLDRQLAKAQGNAEQAEAELADWHGKWTAAIEPLGLSGDATAAVANEVLAQTAELFGRLREAGSLADRIEALNRDAGQFRHEVEQLAAQVDAALAAAPVDHERVAETVISRHRKAAADQQKLETLHGQLRRYEAEREKARRTIGEATSQLDALCQEAGCQQPEELPEAERRSAQWQRLREQLEALDEELSRLSAGASVESFMAEAEAVDADELPGRLAALSDEIARLESDKAELLERRGAEQKALDMIDTSATAADEAEKVQNLLAKIEPDVQQYVRLRLASAVLRRGIERYREKNESPVLNRASELFRKLTLGSFEQLHGDTDEQGNNVLMGLRPGDTVPVGPEAMSDGTSDQLYLALRLASLETWLARNEPIPLIVDDILISFDNQRAVATLEVLAELSRRTQIVFFTHHAHLVELAEEKLDDGLLFVHRLG